MKLIPIKPIILVGLKPPLRRIAHFLITVKVRRSSTGRQCNPQGAGDNFRHRGCTAHQSSAPLQFRHNHIPAACAVRTVTSCRTRHCPSPGSTACKAAPSSANRYSVSSRTVPAASSASSVSSVGRQRSFHHSGRQTGHLSSCRCPRQQG